MSNLGPPRYKVARWMHARAPLLAREVRPVDAISPAFDRLDDFSLDIDLVRHAAQQVHAEEEGL